MNRIDNITHIIANVVTEVALNFPVAYINTVSFFKQGNVVATCDWREQKENAIRINQIQPAFYTRYDHGNDFSEVEITGIDTQGNLFKLFSPLNMIKSNKAA
ncbi:MAG: hypothetical protein H7Y00_00825 [Fimbriimonadaceae bacterium]|nr:hypothetical protein [Chitinophagales bacterium]